MCSFFSLSSLITHSVFFIFILFIFFFFFLSGFLRLSSPFSRFFSSPRFLCLYLLLPSLFSFSLSLLLRVVLLPILFSFLSPLSHLYFLLYFALTPPPSPVPTLPSSPPHPFHAHPLPSLAIPLSFPHFSSSSSPFSSTSSSSFISS